MARHALRAVSQAIPALLLNPPPQVGNWWYAMCAVSPAAGAYYWQNAERTEVFKVKMVTSDDEQTTDITVEGAPCCSTAAACCGCVAGMQLPAVAWQHGQPAGPAASGLHMQAARCMLVHLPAVLSMHGLNQASCSGNSLDSPALLCLVACTAHGQGFLLQVTMRRLSGSGRLGPAAPPLAMPVCRSQC